MWDPPLTSWRNGVRKLVKLDANALAHEAGNILSLNIVMLGALVKHADLPFTSDQMKQAIKENTKEKFLDMNLRAFELGYAA
jgi:indolepyruvate ferredoxin oxidoreductase beta subunit